MIATNVPPSAAVLIDALALPPGALVQQRVAKKLLLEQGAPTAADKRLIQDAIDELTWHAVLKPGTVGVAAAATAAEVAVLVLSLRPSVRDAQTRRMVELVHRAIPYPVLLITHRGTTTSISVAVKRASQADATRWVLAEPVLGTHAFDATQATTHESAFIASLAMHGLPAVDLATLYQGFDDRITALAAAFTTGRFSLPATPAASRARRDAVAECGRLSVALAAARRGAAKARQIARRVEHNLRAQSIEQTLRETQRRLET